MNKTIRKYTAILILCVISLTLGACSPAQGVPGKPKTVRAAVLEIEKYGHAVLDFTASEFSSAGYELGDIVRVRFDSYEAEMPYFDGYYSNPGALMLRGTAPEENIAVCINYGDFSHETGIAVGQTVEITMAEKAGMLALQNLCALRYSNDRADFSDDTVFANFRPVTAGDIGEGKLYRCASPIDNTYSRAAYANDLIEEAGIVTVVNLANSEEDIAAYCRKEDFDSAYYLSLYESGHVIALDLAANFYTDKFADALTDGLRFIARNDPPYCIHCTEGKDRAGFTAMLLEALMGAELREIIDDYMITYRNYYGVDEAKEPDRYEAILHTNLFAMLYHVTGTDSVGELEETDLQAAAKAYLLGHGMTEEEILALQEKIR